MSEERAPCEFVSESELAEARRRRQAEWEKTKRPDQPAERPEEPADSRSLFERLQRQRAEREALLEEQRKPSNQIQLLSEDDAAHLELVCLRQSEAQRMQEEEHRRLAKELAEFRSRQARSAGTRSLGFELPSVRGVLGSAKRKGAPLGGDGENRAKKPRVVVTPSTAPASNNRGTVADQSKSGDTPVPAPANGKSDPDSERERAGEKLPKVAEATESVNGRGPGILPGMSDYLSSDSESDRDD